MIYRLFLTADVNQRRQYLNNLLRLIKPLESSNKALYFEVSKKIKLLTQLPRIIKEMPMIVDLIESRGNDFNEFFVRFSDCADSNGNDKDSCNSGNFLTASLLAYVHELKIVEFIANNSDATKDEKEVASKIIKMIFQKTNMMSVAKDISENKKTIEISVDDLWKTIGGNNLPKKNEKTNSLKEGLK